jgi:hypothetical protein
MVFYIPEKRAGTGKFDIMRVMYKDIMGLGRNVVVAYFEASIPDD